MARILTTDKGKQTMAKTLKIKSMIDDVNYRNHVSTCPAEARQGWNTLLERLLMDADVYAGYNHYDKLAPEAGNHAVGIVWKRDSEGNIKGPHIYPDDTRRHYYIHHSLK
jgi:hypothetical protein